jgi:rod shape-determining protein MreD
MDHIDDTPGIRPRPSWGRRLDSWARAAFPAACTILMMLLTLTPFGFPDQAQLLPAVALCCVWFWSLFRPSSMRPPVVFLIGLLLDLLGYSPLGVGAITLLLAHALAVRFRRFLTAQGFFLVWCSLFAMAALFSMLTWILTSLLFFRILAPQPAVFEWIVTTCIYPAIAVLFVRAHRSLADPGQA